MIVTTFILAVVGVGSLSLRGRVVRGLTLAAPFYWALFSFIAVATAEVALSLHHQQAPIASEAPGAIRFMAAAFVFTPFIALLGAKRPQNRVWQGVVISLWAIISLPAAQPLVFDHPFQLHPAQSWFLALLIAASVVNFLGTRWWLSAILAGAAQWTVMAEHLPGAFSIVSAPWRAAGGIGLGAMATIIPWLLSLWKTSSKRWSAGSGDSLDRLWLDFRDAFGVLWSLRVAERVNAASTFHQWKVTLQWNGFQSAGAENKSSGKPWVGEISAETASQLERTFCSLLRRFVSATWIASRTGRHLQ